MKHIKETADRIKKLEIQGATNIAIQAIMSMRDDLLEADSQSTAQSILEDGVKALVETRETEPMMRNGLKYLQSHVQGRWTSFDIFTAQVEKASSEVLNFFKQARSNIVEIGSKRICDGDTILTHCHSSATTATLIRAHELGKRFSVIQTETRPKYQGRITARELVEAGIDTTMIVDSAARHFMKEIDFAMVGSDAITSEGNVINKIGTSQVAMAAQEARIPFYVVSTLLKFDAETILGEFEVIEERGTDEVWGSPPSGLKIRNPAFDVTRRDYIHGIITEEGIISPHSILEAIHRHYPWILE
ncbi:S-methyl-5-thioribose-1-phosphate isomerase [Candidatus Bathyarchaeota archaeon]|nr:S-methyl-5-thioribose-1-phosphate isomerase [Candidatus Bathyarchaeota archaeon]